MAEYNPSKIIKDGNTYNFRDTTKIPLAGSNAISGSLIPATDNSIDIGSSTKNIKALYTKGITINGTQFLPSNYIPRSGGTVLEGADYARTVDNSALNLYGGTDWDKGAQLQLFGKDWNDPGAFVLYATLNSNARSMLYGNPNGTLTWNNKNLAMQEDTVPRSGGAVLTGTSIGRDTNTSNLDICGGTSYTNGAFIALRGIDCNGLEGVTIIGANSRTAHSEMRLYPDGGWTWTGTACQLVSDQRLKQQINAIDDKLLDAWEDVNLVQFKYNDAVDQKKDKARLHTGYVVQQIDEACKKHNIDVSKYGLYCHEEYPEETEEVEVEQKDGTKTKETKIIREASEHYSLRYTEALIVECAYLRKCIKELRTEIEQLKSSK